MMVARFRVVGWVVGCAIAALCCYLASQQVAAERLALARVDREIAGLRADNARLATEIATRSRLGQIERWNAAFRLGAPSPRQYMASEVELAAYVGGRDRAGPPLDASVVAAHGAVDQVAYIPRPAPVPAAIPAAAPPRAAAPVHPRADVIDPAPAPMLRTAAYVRPRPGRLGDDAPALVKAALTQMRGAVAAKPVARPVAALLPGDLATLAAAERADRRPGRAR